MSQLNKYFVRFSRALLLILAVLVGHSTSDAASMSLNWADNSSNESGFRIERKTGSNGTYAQIATVAVNVRSYVDSSVTAGTTYCYRVRAYNSVRGICKF